MKDIIGEHIQQAGSLVNSNKLRFDYTHHEKLSKKQIFDIEKLINSIVIKNILLNTENMTYNEAKKSGAVGLFGEKYGENVRVVNVPGFSKELCGGTHVNQTGDIGAFKIISESSCLLVHYNY